MILIDTDVLIDLMKGKAEIPGEPLAITTITLYEFLRGTEKIDEVARILRDNFAILGESVESIQISARIWRNLKKNGKPIQDADIIIAGIAIALKIPLWTRNRKHYERLENYGLKLYEEAKE